MRLDFSKITKKESFSYNPDLEKFNERNYSKIIDKFLNVECTIECEKAEDVYILKYKIAAKMMVHSSITDELFEYDTKTTDTLYYTNKKELESEEVFYESKDFIELDQEIYSLIVTSLPIQLHKEGEEYPSGENFRVISEDEAYKDNCDSSPFDILDTLDL